MAALRGTSSRQPARPLPTRRRPLSYGLPMEGHSRRPQKSWNTRSNGGANSSTKCRCRKVYACLRRRAAGLVSPLGISRRAAFQSLRNSSGGEGVRLKTPRSLDGDRQAIDRAEAMLDGSEHQITNVLAADAAGDGEETHGLAITAVEREGDPHPFTVVTADLKAVGAPAAVALIDGDASIMAPLDAAGMMIEQEAVDLHHAVNPLVIGRL